MADPNPMIVVVPGLPVLINFVLQDGGGGGGGNDGGGNDGGGNDGGGLDGLGQDNNFNDDDFWNWLNDQLGIANANQLFDEVELIVPDDMPPVDLDLVPSPDCTALIRAILDGNLKTVECLVENGADLDALNKYNTTSLHIAALEGHVDVMRFLLSKGVDENAPSSIGTPLQVVSKLCCSDARKSLLLDDDAGPSTVSLIPTPPQFCMSRLLECAKLLIQAGADPNGNSCGMSPLASAATKADVELVKFLLESGADPNTRDDIGLKPIEIAAHNGNYREVEALFPFTSPIHGISDWSSSGVMKHVQSKEVKQLIELKLKELHFMAKSTGADALNRKNYLEAAFSFTEETTFFTELLLDTTAKKGNDYMP